MGAFFDKKWSIVQIGMHFLLWTVTSIVTNVKAEALAFFQNDFQLHFSLKMTTALHLVFCLFRYKVSGRLFG